MSDGSDVGAGAARSVLVAGETLDATLRALLRSVVCIDGKIGAGKSTFGRALERVARALNIDVHFERERRQECVLAKFVSDPRAYGALFQMVMLEDSINRQHTCEVVARRGALALLERGPVGNSVFAALNHALGNISERDYEFYASALPAKPFGKTSVLVYLHVSHDVALRRMGVRGDPAEKGYDETYLLALDDAYFSRMVRELVAGALIAPVPWSHQIEQLCDGADGLVAQTDALTLSLSSSVPRVAPDVVAVARYAAAVECGRATVGLMQRDYDDVHTREAVLEHTHDTMRAWESEASPLETLWAFEETETCASISEMRYVRVREFAWDVYTDAVARGDTVARAAFQHALVSSLCAHDTVLLYGLARA